MIKKHADHTIITFHAIFLSDLDFSAKLAKAARSFDALFNEPSWAWLNVNTVVFRHHADRRLFVLAHSQIIILTLGLAPWTDNIEAHVSAVSEALSSMGVGNIKHLGVKGKVFLNLSMTHKEMVDSLFGSYLVSRSELTPFSRSIDDATVRLLGKEGNLDFDLVLTPQTPEQVETDFYAIPNIDNFTHAHTKVDPVTSFLEAIRFNSLSVDCEVHRKDVGVQEVPAFLRIAANSIDTLIARAVNHYQSIGSQGDSNG